MRGRWKIWFYFSLSYSDLIGDKLNFLFLPKFNLFFPWQWLVSDLSLSLSRPWSLSSYFLSPVQLRRGSDRAVLVGTWYLSRPNQNIFGEPARSWTWDLLWEWSNRGKGDQRGCAFSVLGDTQHSAGHGQGQSTKLEDSLSLIRKFHWRPPKPPSHLNYSVILIHTAGSLGSIQTLPTRGPDLLMLFSAFLLPKASEEGRSPQPAGVAERGRATHLCTSTTQSPCSPPSTSITGFLLSIKSLEVLIHHVNFNDSEQRCYADKHPGGFSSGSVLFQDYSCHIAHKVRHGSTVSLPTWI